jgi:hypothetical protein
MQYFVAKIVGMNLFMQIARLKPCLQEKKEEEWNESY